MITLITIILQKNQFQESSILQNFYKVKSLSINQSICKFANLISIIPFDNQIYQSLWGIWNWKETYQRGMARHFCATQPAKSSFPFARRNRTVSRVVHFFFHFFLSSPKMFKRDTSRDTYIERCSMRHVVAKPR